MNPLTVAAQGLAALAVLVALRIAGDPLAAAIVGGSLFAVGLVFQLVFWPKPPPKPPPKGKAWLAPLLASLPVVTFVLLGVVPFILALTAPAGKHHHVYHAHHVADVLLAVACGAACVYAASLIDAYIVSPRLRGDRGKRPCQEVKDAKWRPLTQLWLLHRILAYLAVRISLAAGVVIVVVASIHKPSTAVTSAIVAVSSLVAAYLLNRATPIFISAINPPFYVGDKVWVVEEYAAGEKPQTSYYAVDVSIDGVGLLELADSNKAVDRDPSPGGDAGSARTHDRIVAIGDMGRLLRSRRVFAACATECQWVNKYCPIAQQRREHQSDEMTKARRPTQPEPQPPAGASNA